MPYTKSLVLLLCFAGLTSCSSRSSKEAESAIVPQAPVISVPKEEKLFDPVYSSGNPQAIPQVSVTKPVGTIDSYKPSPQIKPKTQVAAIPSQKKPYPKKAKKKSVKGFSAYALPSETVTQSPASLSAKGINRCALTIDDGPNPNFDPQILDILKREGVKATFFLLGQNAKRHPALVRRMIAEGHEIGNHSWSHPKLTSLSSEGQRKQLYDTQDVLVGLGATVKTFRPPYGLAKKTTMNLAKAKGMETVRWTVDTRDWEAPSADFIVQKVKEQLTNSGNVLIHSTKARTVSALPRIISEMRNRGCTFVGAQKWVDTLKL